MKLWKKGTVEDKSNGNREASKLPANGGNTRFDTHSAMLRRMMQRVNELEGTVSILKRDVARIDRKQYREAEASPKLPVTTLTSFGGEEW